MIRVFILGKPELSRKGIKFLLSKNKEIEVCGETDIYPDGIKNIVSVKPDVIILLRDTTEDNYPEIIKEIHTNIEKLKIVTISECTDHNKLLEILNDRVYSYLCPDAGYDKLVHAIKCAANEEKYFSPKFIDFLLPMIKIFHPGLKIIYDGLNDKEKKMVELLREGNKLEVISSGMNINIKDACYMKNRIIKKFGAKNLTELIIKTTILFMMGGGDGVI